MLQVKKLETFYGQLEAVKGISFEVNQGGCFGLFGPNGAGKTTTLEMLEGILPPTAGQIVFNGQALDNAYSEKIGIQLTMQAKSLPLHVQQEFADFDW